MGDEHHDRHAPELHVDSAAAPRLEPHAAAGREVDPNWAPPLAASCTACAARLQVVTFRKS